MNLSLRAKLRLPENCSEVELREACNRYYSIYKGVLESSTSEAVKTVAYDKMKDLIEETKAAGIYLEDLDEASFEYAAVNQDATVEQELHKETNALTPERAAYLDKKIAALPHSAKRFYLSALVTLRRRDASFDNYREAATKLKSACSEDPDNIVYQAALENIKDEIQRHNTQLVAWQEAKLEEIRKEKRIATAKAIFKGIGTALLWIGGAALTIAAGLFSCICGILEGC